MVNNSVLIKVVRSLGYIDWPSEVNYMRLHLKKLLLGFPGINLGHISLVKFKDLLDSDLFILDPSLISEDKGTPIMYSKEGKIIGIGAGPYTGKTLDSIDKLEISPEFYVLRVDCRPKDTGGPGYYYFYKSKRNYECEQEN